MLVGIVEKIKPNLEVMKKFLEQHGYEVVAAIDYSEFDRLYSASIILIDVAGFDSKIWSFCEELRKRKIPFIIFYPKADVAMTKGAEAAAFKPVNPKRLLELIEELEELTLDKI